MMSGEEERGCRHVETSGGIPALSNSCSNRPPKNYSADRGKSNHKGDSTIESEALPPLTHKKCIFNDQVR